MTKNFDELEGKFFAAHGNLIGLLRVCRYQIKFNNGRWVCCEDLYDNQIDGKTYNVLKFLTYDDAKRVLNKIILEYKNAGLEEPVLDIVAFDTNGNVI